MDWHRGILLLSGLLLCACADRIRPGLGLDWNARYKEISPGIFHIHVAEGRFSGISAADDLFRVTAQKVVDLNHCSGYRIRSYSTYLKDAFPAAAVPVIEGEIECLHRPS